MERVPNTYQKSLGELRESLATRLGKHVPRGIMAKTILNLRKDAKLAELLSLGINNTIRAKIIENTALGLVYQADYWLISYNQQLVEVKQAHAWRQICKSYGARELKDVRTMVIFKEDRFELRDVSGEAKYNYIPCITSPRDYKSVVGAVCIVYFEDGSNAYRTWTYSEIDRLRKLAKTQVVWEKHFKKMIESKIIRETLIRNVELDFEKFNAKFDMYLDKNSIDDSDEVKQPMPIEMED